MIHILFLLALVFSFSSTSHASNNDFCVADLKGPEGPSGYPCKPPNTLSADDFTFKNFTPGNTSNPFKISFILASVHNFPAVNGGDISAGRIDIEEGGSAPMHTHPGGSEVLMMVTGVITVGIITPSHVFVKELKPGHCFFIPQGVMHFLLNSGKGRATVFASYSSANPRLHVFDILAFGNNLPSSIVSQTTLINVPEVKRLKNIFGGTN
ncbi:hypothetical protein RJT34_17333 [Clitoria ternatea]|uniref:Germin-like protein n=1 Tax=Clitoria ternatea TaxID=43366 RepID=A0AAN9JBW9_CLITE